jgi:hypothetical protein
MTSCPIPPSGGPCGSYMPGHAMHVIHANRLARTPWGWRDATVLSVDGGLVRVAYLSEPGTAEMWHHRSLDDVLTVGTSVRVHERLHAIGGAFGWANVEVRSGLGPVPEPEQPAVWHAETVDAATRRWRVAGS